MAIGLLLEVLVRRQTGTLCTGNATEIARMNHVVIKSIKIVFEIENTMLMFFYIKFIKRDQTQRRNGEACRASSTCFWSSLINFISKDTYMVCYISCIFRRF